MENPESLDLPLVFEPPASMKADEYWDSSLRWDWGANQESVPWPRLEPQPGFEVLLEARFDTTSLDKNLLSRFKTIQLTTKITGRCSSTDNKDVYTWVNIALHRSWDYPGPRPGPRANLIDGGSLCWRSHSNHAKSWDENNENQGRVFSQNDQLIKQLEFGDIIAVTLCARSIPEINTMDITGGLTVKLLDHGLNKNSGLTGRYRYWATGPETTGAMDHNIDSKIWFFTPALDKNTLSKLDAVQLFTESRDQGWIEDADTASYSWFDLIILSSPHDTQPRIVDGIELAWRSHFNGLGHKKFEVLEGFIFDNGHDILRLLEVGNAIAVRMSSRFSGWDNVANDGFLELRFSDTEIEYDPIIPQQSLVDAARIKRVLVDYMVASKKNGTHTIELDPVVLDLLKHPVSWDQKGGQDKPGLTLLSLDGGGVRGLLSLHMLKAIMEQIREDRKLEKTPKPCEIFDLIVGTSTGGLIALMLARLEMTVDDCITEYEALATDVFGTQNAERYNGLFGGFLAAKDKVQKTFKQVTDAIYDADKLEKTIKRVVQTRDKSKDPDAKMWSDTKCRAVVIASLMDNVSTESPTHFRTYSSKSVGGPDCRIWEAARATTAAPTYFKSIKVQGTDYVDGGLQANNPVIQTLSDAMVLFEDPRPVDCLVSLGTGMPPKQALKHGEGFFDFFGNLRSLGKAILHQLTNAHLEHLNVSALNVHNQLAKEYYRFNAPIKAVTPISSEDPEAENKLVDLDDTSRMEQFKEASMNYFTDEKPLELMKACARTLSGRLDG